MLSEVTMTIADNGSIAGNDTGSGIHAKVGVSNVAGTEPIVIRQKMDADTIRKALGNSPLADACIDAVENGAETIYCMPVSAAVNGSIGAVQHAGEGTGTVEASGTPVNDFTVIVRIEGSGVTNEATVSISEDGGATWGEEQTIPLSGTLVLPNNGIELTFAADGGNTFVAGDTYTFQASAPSAGNEDILKAVDVLRHYKKNYEFIHVVGTTTPALWAALETVGQAMEDKEGRPIFFLCEQRYIKAEEDVETYVNAILPEAKGIKGRHVSVIGQWATWVRNDGSEHDINMAGPLSGWIASGKESTSIAYTNEFSFAEEKVKKLLPDGIEEYMEVLDDARYVILRSYPGLEGYYAANTVMTIQADSDFANIEDVRVMYRIAREVYKRSLLHQNADFDQSSVEEALIPVQADLNVPIDEAVEEKLISSGSVTILFDEINSGREKTLPVEITYVPRGYLRRILLRFYVANALA